MRAPLQYTMPPHNDSVESQRPGFCLCHKETGRFITSVKLGAMLPNGQRCRVITLGRAKDALVFSSRYEAIQAMDNDYEITSAPRHNGTTWEWESR